MMGTPRRLSGSARLSGVCPPNCTMTPSGFSVSHDVEDVLQRERLEVEAIAGVVIGGYGLGIAVDHDRFDAHFLQSERLAWQQQ